MKNKTYRFAAVAAVLLAFCLVFMMPVGATNVASVTNSDGTSTIEYATLQDALKALTSGATLTLLDDVTITESWDCRNNGAKITVPVTIDGKGHTLKLTGTVDDKNWNTVFRFEADATVKNLTIDVSEATGVQRGITAKLNITVDNCKFIGNEVTSRFAIIFGEGAGTSISNVEASITNSEFKDWGCGVTDNKNGQDAKSVSITNNKFENAEVEVSASDEIIFTNNEMTDSGVNIYSYSSQQTPTLKVTATGNTLDEEMENEIGSKSGIQSLAVDDDSNFALELIKVDDAYYGDIQEAIKAAAPSGTVEILGDITVDTWYMFAERMTHAEIITLNINGLTIDGNDHTLTVKSIKSGGNGGYLFYSAEKLNINDLTIKNDAGIGGGFGLQSGTISGVTIEGGEGIHPGTGEITIEDCTFKTTGSAIYYETPSDNLVITGNTFEGTGEYAVIIRGATTFTDNTVTSGKVNLANSASGTISGNNFGDNRFKVYNDATATITDNVINNLVFDNEEAVKSAFGDNTLSDEAQAALNSVDYVVLPSTQPATPSSSSGGHSEPGAYYNYPRTVSDGGLVEFGTSKVVKSVTLPAGSNGAVVLHIDSTAYWPLATDSEFTFDISVENLGVGTSYISFKIDESKLSALDITAADVGVYHNVNGEWVKLTVTYKIEEGDVIYTAETDSFSPFKLVVEAGAAKPAETQDEPVTPPTEEPSDEPQDVPGEILPEIPGVQDEPEEPSSPAPLLGVLAALGAAVVLRRK